MALAALAGTGSGSVQPTKARATPAKPRAVPAALVNAAKSEGTLTWYSALPTTMNQQIADAFRSKYGITVQYLKLGGTELLNRYASEAQSGQQVADVAVGATADTLVYNGVHGGWILPLAKANIPAYAAYPKDWKKKSLAIVNILPWLIAYNKNVLGSTPPPTSWNDLFDPRFKGKILIIDPGTSDAYVQLWKLVMKHYGPRILERIAANSPKIAGGGPVGIQGLAAGEGALLAPTVAITAETVMSQGAPVDVYVPKVTTGVEEQLWLSAKSPHPNAGRLFANFLLTAEAHKLLSPNSFTYAPLSPRGVPKGYKHPPGVTKAEAATVKSIFKK